EESVAAAADDDRQVLVGELRPRAVRVPVPDPNRTADQVEPAEPLAAPVEMVVGIEQQGLDDTANAPDRIMGKALDLEPGARPESLAGEVGVVVDLMSQEAAVRRPEDELPGVEARLDDDVGGAQRDAVRALVDRPRTRVRPADDVAEALGGRHMTMRRP